MLNIASSSGLSSVSTSSGRSSATPEPATPQGPLFPDHENSRKRIAFRPRSDTIQNTKSKNQGFWLQIVYEQDGYDRPDSFDMSELVNLYSIFFFQPETSQTETNESLKLTTKLSRLPEERTSGVSEKESSPSPGQRQISSYRADSATVEYNPSSLSPAPPQTSTPLPAQPQTPSTVNIVNHPMIALYNQYGNILKDNQKIIEEERKKDFSKDPVLYYMSINYQQEPDHPYMLLNNEVEKLILALKIIDTRNPDTTTSSYLTDCLTIVRGLHVSKATTIDNVIEPLYAVCEGMLWTVHNLHRVSKRVLAELEMINIELRRRLDSTIDIKNLLRQKKTPGDENDRIGDIVAALARCLDAKLTFTWYKHNLSVTKHLTASRKAEVEGEMFTLINLIETTPNILALCKKKLE